MPLGKPATNPRTNSIKQTVFSDSNKQPVRGGGYSSVTRWVTLAAAVCTRNKLTPWLPPLPAPGPRLGAHAAACGAGGRLGWGNNWSGHQLLAKLRKHQRNTKPRLQGAAGASCRYVFQPSQSVSHKPPATMATPTATTTPRTTPMATTQATPGTLSIQSLASKKRMVRK